MSEPEEGIQLMERRSITVSFIRIKAKEHGESLAYTRLRIAYTKHKIVWYWKDNGSFVPVNDEESAALSEAYKTKYINGN